MLAAVHVTNRIDRWSSVPRLYGNSNALRRRASYQHYSCANAMSSGSSKKKYVLFLGDSHTVAQYGADWVQLLEPSLKSLGFDTVRDGVNGELADAIGVRLGPNLQRHGPPAAAVILAGTNNVIAAFSPSIYNFYKSGNMTKRPATLDIYTEEMTAMLKQLRMQQQAPACKVFLIALPPIGEQLDHPIQAAVQRHNDVLLQLSKQFDNVKLVDVHATCVQYLQQHQNPSKPPSKPSIEQGLMGMAWWMVVCYALHKLLWLSFDKVASFRSRLLLHDDIHIDNKAAHLLALQLQPLLQKAFSS